MKVGTFLGAVAIVLAALPDTAQGCGDKFLVPGRGVRFPSRANREAAAVLLYAPSGSTLSAAVTSLSLEVRLRGAGYRPLFITNETTFDSLLRSGAWDVVVVDLGNAPSVQRRLTSTQTAVVLPVATDADSAMLAQIKRDYPQVLKSPARDRAFVDALDKIIVAKARTKSKTRGA